MDEKTGNYETNPSTNLATPSYVGDINFPKEGKIYLFILFVEMDELDRWENFLGVIWGYLQHFGGPRGPRMAQCGPGERAPYNPNLGFSSINSIWAYFHWIDSLFGAIKGPFYFKDCKAFRWQERLLFHRGLNICSSSGIWTAARQGLMKSLCCLLG